MQPSLAQTAQILQGVQEIGANTSLEDVIRSSVNQLLYWAHCVIHRGIAGLYVPTHISQF